MDAVTHDDNEIADLGSPGGDNMSVDSQQRKYVQLRLSDLIECRPLPLSGSDSEPFAAATVNAAPDSFKTEYHPKSGRAAEYESFSSYGKRSFPPTLPDDAPWAPFLSRVDFEIAELTHQSAMSKEQIDHLLKIIWLISDASGQSGFTLRSSNDVANAWSRVAPRLTPVCIAH